MPDSSVLPTVLPPLTQLYQPWDADRQVPSTVCALGTFDGLHRGHLAVLKQTLTAAQSKKAQPVLFTFASHPRLALFPEKPLPLLACQTEREALLNALSHWFLVVALPFDKTLRNLPPHEFVEKVLLQWLRSNQVCVGPAFRYGHQGAGTLASLRTQLQNAEAEVSIVAPHEYQDERISSSRIRDAIGRGDLLLAETMLGRPYSVQGQVQSGRSLARTLGVPTLNVSCGQHKAMPPFGVYVGWLQLPDQPKTFPAIANFGVKPTVDGTPDASPLLEIHALTEDAGLSFETPPSSVTFHLGHALRAEQRFANLEALQNQIWQDCEQARQWHQQEGSRFPSFSWAAWLSSAWH
jgi:riboflavin kinase / FMN adenylyltransferase